MHLFLSLNHSLVLKERLLGFKTNVFFLTEEPVFPR